MGERRILIFEFLQVVGQDDAGDRPLVVGDAYRAVDQMPDLFGNARHPDIFGDVLKQVLQIDFLLIAGAESGSRLLAYECDDGHVIHLGIVEPVQEMDRTGPGRRVAQADLTGEFRVRRGHKGCHLLVPDLNIFHAFPGLLERHIETSDTVSGIPVDPLQAPCGQSMPNEFADVHAFLPWRLGGWKKCDMSDLTFRPRRRCIVNAF